jgi:hypothetical protein
MHLSEMHSPAAAAEREGCAEDLVRMLGVVQHLPVAVGTAIAGRPPHRSVRAELPHTAPALDASACHQGRRPTHCSWYLETRNPALSPARSHTRAILLGVRPSLHHLRSACPFGAARIVRQLHRYYGRLRLLEIGRAGRAA